MNFKLGFLVLFVSLSTVPANTLAECKPGDYPLIAGTAVGGGTGQFVSKVGLQLQAPNPIGEACATATAAATAEADRQVAKNCASPEVRYIDVKYKATLGMFNHTRDPAPFGTASCNVGIEVEYSCCGPDPMMAMMGGAPPAAPAPAPTAAPMPMPMP